MSKVKNALKILTHLAIAFVFVTAIWLILQMRPAGESTSTTGSSQPYPAPQTVEPTFVPEKEILSQPDPAPG